MRFQLSPEQEVEDYHKDLVQALTAKRLCVLDDGAVYIKTVYYQLA